jgi:hypothetical protein
MNDEFQKKIIEWVQNITSFAADKIPEFAQEILNYKFAEHIFGSIICILAFSLLLKISNIAYKKHEPNSYSDGPIALCIVTAILSIIPFGIFIVEFNNVLKVWLAPKLYLLEMFLHKGNKCIFLE